MKKRLAALTVVAAVVVSLAAAASVNQPAAAQCSNAFGAPVPCGNGGGGGGERQKRPTKTVSPSPQPGLTPVAAALAPQAAACTPDPADPTALCTTPPDGSSNPAVPDVIGQRPPSPNFPAPAALILGRWGQLVVILFIIAILLAIAIPTFLGARNSANARTSRQHDYSTAPDVPDALNRDPKSNK